jgi:hypothetical protein
MYLPNSIKAIECQRWGSGEKLIVQGEMTKKHADWKQFLTNDENKKQLINIILKVWSSDEFSAYLDPRKIIVISEGHAYQLQTVDSDMIEIKSILSLLSNQEQTDTHVILYCKFSQDGGYEYVKVRSPDRDIFFHSSALHTGEGYHCHV